MVRHKDAWARLPIGKKLMHLDAMRVKTDDVAEAWVAAAVKAKRIPSEAPKNRSYTANHFGR